MSLVSRIVGARLRELRLEAGLTTVEMAERLQGHREIVSRAELGRCEPTVATVVQWCAALRVNPLIVLRAVDHVYAPRRRLSVRRGVRHHDRLEYVVAAPASETRHPWRSSAVTPREAPGGRRVA